MQGGRICKKIAGIMLVVVLVSFFCVVLDKVPVSTAEKMQKSNQSVLCAVENKESDFGKLPNQGTQIVTAKNIPFEVVKREQKTVRIGQLRLVAVVCLLLCAIRVVYRVTLRRFGCRMIKRWENIVYIHQSDGAKGNALLYEK